MRIFFKKFKLESEIYKTHGEMCFSTLEQQQQQKHEAGTESEKKIGKHKGISKLLLNPQICEL